MKKNLTLLSIGLLTGSIVFGQNISKNIPFQHAKKHSIAHKVSTTNLNQEKVEGDIIWEDDFSDEANWVTANTSTPTHGWRIETDADLSPVAALSPIATPTVDNGFAFVNSDEAGTQTNPSSTNADITNATPIDLTLHDNVTLEFYNVTRNFASEYRVYVSGNNGADWTEYVVNQNITTNVNTENPELVKVNISAAAANQDEVLIRFNFIAEWGWFWAIDDVKIVESPGNDITMTQLLATTGVQGFQYTKLPTTQIPSTKMSFGSKVRNDGSLSQDLTMTVSSSAGADISSPVYTIASQASDSLAIEEPNGFTIPSTVGVYDFTATIDNDAVANGEVYLLDEASLAGGSGYADATGVAVTGGSGTGLTLDIVATTDGPVLTLDDASLNGGTGYVDATGVAVTGGSGTDLTLNIEATTDGPVAALNDASLVGGTGYTVASGVATTGGLGSGLTVNINEIADGIVSTLDNTTLLGGTGYEDATGVATTGGTGTGLTVDITEDGSGVVNAVVVNQGGTGYVVGDVVTISGGGEDATIQVLTVESGVITTVAVNQGGTGYEVGDEISITGGNDDATIEVLTVESGIITTVAVNQAGTGYEVGDVITIDGGNGDATIEVLTVDATGEIISVVVNQVGSGYVAGETVTIDGGDGNATIDIWSIGELVNTEDDALTHPFEVTTKVMAVDSWDGTPVAFSGAFTGWVGDAADPGIGADYEVFQDAMLERVQVGVFPVADESPYVGNGLFVQLYQYDFDQATYVFRAISMTHEIVSADFGTLVNIQFEEPISLQAGDIILPIASFFTGAEVPIGFSGNTIAGSVVGIGDGGIIGLAAEGDLVDAPMVRLDFGTYLNIEESSLVATDVNLYPNPASNNATVEFSLANESAVSVEVRDLAGKLIYASNEGQLAAGSHSLNLSTAAMAEGIYTYTLSANGAQVTKKFIVKK